MFTRLWCSPHQHHFSHVQLGIEVALGYCLQGETKIAVRIHSSGLTCCMFRIYDLRCKVQVKASRIKEPTDFVDKYKYH
jgi:hypothetical protein